MEATPSGQYIQRTEWNVRDSNGTVIFARRDKLTAGSRKTAESARKQGKPFLHLAAQHGGANAAFLLQGLIQQNRIEVLKVAGSRLSGASEAEAVRPLGRDRDRAGAGADGTGVRRVPTRPR